MAIHNENRGPHGTGRKNFISRGWDAIEKGLTFKNRSRSNRAPGVSLEAGRKRTSALFDEKVAAQRRASEEQIREERKGAEKGITVAAGRSRRAFGSGAQTANIAGIGADLQGRAAARRASADLQALDTQFEKEQFLADSLVTEQEAGVQINDYIDSIESEYESFWDDDEEGLAQAMESYAVGKSENVKAAALQAAADLRSGKRKIGWW